MRLLKIVYVALVFAVITPTPGRTSWCLYSSQDECIAACDWLANANCGSCYTMFLNYCRQDEEGCWVTDRCDYYCWC